MHTCASWHGKQCCKRKFSFLSHQKGIFHFPSIKNGRFCEATTKWLIQKTTNTFYKNTRPPYMDNVPTGGSETFPSTSGEKDKFLSNQQEVGQIWTTGTWYDAHDFLQKSFLGSQYAILSKRTMQVERGLVRFKCIQKMRHLNIQSIQKC